MNENDYHLQGGPNAPAGLGPELWVPEKTAYLPEQSFVATGLRSKCEACGIVSDGLTLEVCCLWYDVRYRECGGVRCEV